MCPSPCPSLPHEITFFKRERVCLWFWACAPFSECHVSRVVTLARTGAETSERHTSTGTSTGAFTSAGGHRWSTREATKQENREKKTQRAFYKRKYASCECWNQPMCTNWSRTSKKRRPAGTETGPNGPRKVTRRKPKSDSLPVYLAPISALKTCDNCCSNLFVNYCNQSDRGRDLILQHTDPSVSPP